VYLYVYFYDISCLQTSAEAVGDVTSAALELLGSFSHVISGRGDLCNSLRPVDTNTTVVEAMSEECEVAEELKQLAPLDSFKHLEEQVGLSAVTRFHTACRKVLFRTYFTWLSLCGSSPFDNEDPS